MIILLCILGSGFLGALTAALIFYRSIFSEEELQRERDQLSVMVLTLALGVPLIALMSFGDGQRADGSYMNGHLGQYLPGWTLLSYAVGFFHAWLAIRVIRQRTR